MISFSTWHALPLATRVLIANQFGISKVGPTHVFDNRIESDGYRFQDIERAISTEAMQAFTGSSTKDDLALFELTLQKILNPVVLTELPRVEVKETPKAEPAKKTKAATKTVTKKKK